MTMGGLTYPRTLSIELWGAVIAMALSLQDPGALVGQVEHTAVSQVV